MDFYEGRRTARGIRAVLTATQATLPKPRSIAPEKKQPFGQRSRQHLASLVFDRNIRAECGKRDRYGREVCKVLDGSRDVGLE